MSASPQGQKKAQGQEGLLGGELSGKFTDESFEIGSKVFRLSQIEERGKPVRSLGRLSWSGCSTGKTIRTWGFLFVFILFYFETESVAQAALELIM